MSSSSSTVGKRQFIIAVNWEWGVSGIDCVCLKIPSAGRCVSTILWYLFPSELKRLEPTYYYSPACFIVWEKGGRRLCVSQGRE